MRKLFNITKDVYNSVEIGDNKRSFGLNRGGSDFRVLFIVLLVVQYL